MNGAHPEPGRDWCWKCGEDSSVVFLDAEGHCAGCVYGARVLAAETDEEYDRVAELGLRHVEREIAEGSGAS